MTNNTACPACGLAGSMIADERDALQAGHAEWKRLAESLLASIGQISAALGISEEDQSCANGNDEILAAIEELKLAAPAPQAAAAEERMDFMTWFCDMAPMGTNGTDAERGWNAACKLAAPLMANAPADYRCEHGIGAQDKCRDCSGGVPRESASVAPAASVQGLAGVQAAGWEAFILGKWVTVSEEKVGHLRSDGYPVRSNATPDRPEKLSEEAINAGMHVWERRGWYVR